MHTLGGFMVSSDDDMRPYCMVEYSPESLTDDEVCRGRLHKAGENGYTRKSFDFISAFLDVVGKPASLGLRINGIESKISFVRPLLPLFLNETRILNLQVAGSSVDLELIRHEHDIGVNVLRRQGEIEIAVVR